jgi:hypothetical protein
MSSTQWQESCCPPSLIPANTFSLTMCTTFFMPLGLLRLSQHTNARICRHLCRKLETWLGSRSAPLLRSRPPLLDLAGSGNTAASTLVKRRLVSSSWAAKAYSSFLTGCLLWHSRAQWSGLTHRWQFPRQPLGPAPSPRPP